MMRPSRYWRLGLKQREHIDQICRTMKPEETPAPDPPPSHEVPDYSQDRIEPTEALLRKMGFKPKDRNANPDEDANGRHGQGN